MWIQKMYIFNRVKINQEILKTKQSHKTDTLNLYLSTINKHHNHNHPLNYHLNRHYNHHLGATNEYNEAS